MTLNFENGFPETDSELHRQYGARLHRIKQTGIVLRGIKQIKNHRLEELLVFTGDEQRILNNCFKAWNTVRVWSPETRYRKKLWKKAQAEHFLQAAKIVLHQIS